MAEAAVEDALHELDKATFALAVSSERNAAYRDAAIECDGWADAVLSVSCFSWLRPLERARNKGQIFAYRSAAAALREMADSNE